MNETSDINIKDIVRRHIVQPKIDSKNKMNEKAIELTICDDTKITVNKCE